MIPNWGCVGTNPVEFIYEDMEATILNLCLKLSHVLLRTVSSCSSSPISILEIAANLRKENEGFNSFILENAEKVLKQLYYDHKSPIEASDKFQVISDSIAADLIYEIQLVYLWMSVENTWVLENSENPDNLTPNFDSINISLDQTGTFVKKLEIRSEVLNRIVGHCPKWEDFQESITKVWEGSLETFSDSYRQNWEKIISRYDAGLENDITNLRILSRNNKDRAKHLIDQASRQLGLARSVEKDTFDPKRKDKDKNSLIRWLRRYEEANGDWHHLKEVETAVYDLGKELSLFTAKFLWSISHDKKLVDWFKRWRLSLSILAWNRMSSSPSVLVPRFIEAVLYAEKRLAILKNARSSSVLKEPVNEQPLLTSEQFKALGKIECLVLREETTLTEPIWPRVPTPSLLDSAQQFLTQSRVQLGKLNKDLIVDGIDMGSRTVEQDIEEIWRDSFDPEKREQEKISLVRWLRKYDEGSRLWHQLKDVETAAYEIGYELSLFTTRFLYISHSKGLLPWFERWRQSLAMKTWERKNASPCVLVPRFIKVILYAEEQVKKASGSTRLLLPTWKEFKALQEVQRIILKAETLLTDLIWSRTPASLLDSVQLFLTESRGQLGKLNTDLALDEVHLGSKIVEEEIEEIWRGYEN